MIWNKVFETGDLANYSNRTLVAIANSGLKSLIAGNSKTRSYEKGLVAIAYRLNCNPTREGFYNYCKNINQRPHFDSIDLVLSMGHLNIDLALSKTLFADRVDENDLIKSHQSIIEELTNPVFESWGEDLIDWNPDAFVSHFPETYPGYFNYLKKYNKVFHE